ncbi:MAG: hypothetical protein HRU69_14150 [Flammeovirgaceae bacterium]|nr:MAG: hypothetical protein HRU69_14150 [Flammeovirgaceae bacterium]
MNKHLIFLCICLNLTSCKNAFFYTDLYTRANRKSTFFEKNYDAINTLTINDIRICREFDWPGTRYQTRGRILFQRDSLEESIRNALENHFSKVIYETSQKPFWDENCDSIVVKNYRSKARAFVGSKHKEHSIFAALNITPRTAKNIDAGILIEAPFPDLGNDIHRIEYKFIVAIFKNESLIYMDSRSHWTEVFSERDEQLHYQVPQEIIETLVTLSLEEYFKRVKK